MVVRVVGQELTDAHDADHTGVLNPVVWIIHAMTRLSGEGHTYLHVAPGFARCGDVRRCTAVWSSSSLRFQRSGQEAPRLFNAHAPEISKFAGAGPSACLIALAIERLYLISHPSLSSLSREAHSRAIFTLPLLIPLDHAEHGFTSLDRRRSLRCLVPFPCAGHALSPPSAPSHRRRHRRCRRRTTLPHDGAHPDLPREPCHTANGGEVSDGGRRPERATTNTSIDRWPPVSSRRRRRFG